MKRFFVTAAIATVLAFNSTSVSAKDAAFAAFWVKFQAALKTNDKEAIASMTRLPYQLDSKSLDKKAFVLNCDKIFSKKVRTCLAKEKPVQDKTSFSAFCGEEIYIFEKVNGKYLFTEIGVND
ncbi:MAG: hypothetical protein SGJ27_21325 [Candidatus Melainabacteria bacterium]|nr:hypothetical protein [Candidatus Melainabacteria bacterium]